jgi:hypothetical protein
MALTLTVFEEGTVETDGTVQPIGGGGALVVNVAELDASSLASGDRLVVRWRVNMAPNQPVVWETSLSGGGSQTGILTPPIPIPASSGFFEIEQTDGVTPRSIGWVVFTF